MRYRVFMSVVIETADDNQAYAQAAQLGELLKEPFVRMAVEGKGVRLAGDSAPIVYAPQPERIEI